MGSVRKRLWLAASALGICLLLLLAMNAAASAPSQLNWREMGHDFRVFYCGGMLARSGQARDLYDIDRIWAMEKELVAKNKLMMGPGLGPWWNPPHAALLFVPFTYLSYPLALLLWEAISLAAFAISIVLLVKMLPEGTSWKSSALVPLILAVSMPFVQAMTTGQNTLITLLLLCATTTLWRSGRAYLAGVVCGLLAYKPQHCALIGVVMVMNQGRAALWGLATTGILTLAVTVGAMPGALTQFLTRMPENLRQFHESNHYMWERQITFKGFWRLLIQGRQTGPTAASVIAAWAICWTVLAGMLAQIVWQARKTTRESAISIDHLIAATIAATPLLMPFYFDYDLLLLAVPAVLYARDRLIQKDKARFHWETIAWAALFVCLYGQALMARRLRVSVTALTVGWIVVLRLRKAIAAKRNATNALEPPHTLPLNGVLYSSRV